MVGIGEVAGVLSAVANAGKIAEYAGRLLGRGKPQVELDISLVGAPMAKVGEHYNVHIHAFVRLRLRNPTGDEARLEDPYLLWREVRLFGRRRELRKLRLSDNATDTARDLSEIVPRYKEGKWLQDLCFYCDWVPPMPTRPGARPALPT